MKNWLKKIASDQSGRIDIIILQFFLWILSVVYSFGVILRNLAYTIGISRSHSLSVPVISVGNITVGGSGKTPLVEFIARFIKTDRKLAPAILTRGYMEQEGQESDEARMLKNHLPQVPVIVGKNRLQLAQEFLKTAKADVFILDDGFQHRQIKRDLDIVVVDATNPFGNGQLLPRGILREPVSSIERAHMVVLTRVNLVADKGASVVNKIKKINSAAVIAKTIHRPTGLHNLRWNNTEPLARIANQKIVSCSSIGNPQAFDETLVGLKAQLVKSFQFPDHHAYEMKDIEMIDQFCKKNNISLLLITEKDAVKFSRFLSKIKSAINVFALQIEIAFVEGEDLFLNGIRHILLR